MGNRLFRGLMVVFLASSVGLFAESFKFKEGRLDQEKVMELQLSPAQTKQVKLHFKPGMIIKLTKSQRTQIKVKTGIAIVPTKLELWKQADLEHDCTCFLWNIGLVFKDGWLELPIARLVSDKEAEGRRPDPNG